MISAAEGVLKLFQNYFSDIKHVGKFSNELQWEPNASKIILK